MLLLRFNTNFVFSTLYSKKYSKVSLELIAAEKAIFSGTKLHKCEYRLIIKLSN